VVNINSEAESRRLTVHKAVELINTLRASIEERIILVGAPKEKAFVDGVFHSLTNTADIENRAGATSLKELSGLLASARLMLSTDSGPAHLANALGTQTLVLFGAGNEKHTAPSRQDLLQVIRLGELSCEPCQKNVCIRFGTPQCLERLDTTLIVDNAKRQLADGKKFI
jgi:ADP-heptose:LPS heptosyltransferase